ncbi:hypothetical protein GALMADRAFT_238374 [Galerina marginata CBS 339.88]|uniref:Probable 26S proteasome regulatory subunit p27 n=1 Tax=Galerina marginata (strain CBS 339.88) TaxID=685588 RepID=A0A067TKF0_GALM3|nr:hypothetical protein GALMADRAFT_238374 [Galerina marginata CBS 339.88]
MGLQLPNPESPMEQARALMSQKDNIEAELETHISILKANNVTMQTPLVDAEGFPRADIDIYAVRSARVRIIELRNDLKAIMDAIGKALEGVYDPALAVTSMAAESSTKPSESETPKPFAKVDGVAPGSPAAEALLQKGDLVVKFGPLDQISFKWGSLQQLADVVKDNENRAIPIRVLRSEQTLLLTLTPRNNWGGRGMLGCHIVSYNYPPS